MNAFIETTALQLIGFVTTSNAQAIDNTIDVLADRVIEAVKNTETLFDDTAADALANALTRLAVRIDAGLKTVGDGVNGATE